MPLFEKSSDEPLAFANFLVRLRVTPSPRGDLIARFKTLINASAFPAITSWADLYRFMSRSDASDDAIGEARKLWHQYKSLTQFQSAVPPATNWRQHA